MSVSPIGAAQAASAIASLVRQALNGQAERHHTARESQKTSGKRKTNGQAKLTGEDDLPALIARRLEELRPDAPDYRSRVLRLLVEAALLQEFGGNLINSPRFQSLIDMVSREINAAPQMQNDLDTLLASLIPSVPDPKKGDDLRP